MNASHEYTPSTEEVRKSYIKGDGGLFADDEFDRWLAAHDIEVAGEADTPEIFPGTRAAVDGLSIRDHVRRMEELANPLLVLGGDAK